MRADHQKLYAALVLQLLLDGNPELCKTVSLTGNEFVHLLKQNLVLLRVAKRLESMGLKPSGLFADAVEEERQRIQAEFALIHKLSQLCLDRGIEHIFAKAFKHYPDMGHEIDLFVLSRSTRVDAQLIKALNASPRKPNLCNRIAGTVNYRVPACESLLEIHHGRLGNLGEHRSFLGTLIKNGKRVEIEGLQFQVPSPEDQLILQVLQRVYGCRYLRLSDIAHAISSIRRDALDWDYILENATLLGQAMPKAIWSSTGRKLLALSKTILGMNSESLFVNLTL